VFTLGSLYHLCHVVDDIGAVDEWYQSVFDALPVKHSSEPAAMREASFVVIGDLLLEAMQVSDMPGAEGSALGRFRARYGQHLHSVAMFVDSVDAAADALGEHGIRLLDIAGSPIGPERPVPTPWMWTHPKDTRGTYEFACMPEFHYDPRFHASWSGRYWRDHPIGIEYTSHITVLLSRLEDARPVFGEAFGGDLLHEESRPGIRRSAYFTLGPDMVIQATEPLDPNSPAGVELSQHGEGLFGLTFAVRDLTGAERHLERRGQQVRRIEEDTIMLDPAQAFGLAVGFTQARIPNDRRRAGVGVRR